MLCKMKVMTLGACHHSYMSEAGAHVHIYAQNTPIVFQVEESEPQILRILRYKYFD